MLYYLLPFFPLAFAKNIEVDVGKEGLTFKPNSIQAAQGDTIEFHFYGETHDVAVSSFNSPCQPIDNGGFYSGMITPPRGSDSDDDADKKFVVSINGTDPVWIYCSVGSHCQSGMVGVINPPQSGDTLESYRNAASNARSAAPSSAFGGRVTTGDDDNDIVGQNNTSTGGGDSSGNTASGSGGTTTTSTTTTQTGSSPTSTSSSGGSDAWSVRSGIWSAITAGGVVACMMAVF